MVSVILKIGRPTLQDASRLSSRVRFHWSYSVVEANARAKLVHGHEQDDRKSKRCTGKPRSDADTFKQSLLPLGVKESITSSLTITACLHIVDWSFECTPPDPASQ
uniref:Uncharacterized protein n=1 Tax=Physcomitrium patens TaxID=3218 RepID=A0A2K1L7E6_PHYPA|nr:hypothetical protein PHYPA_000371 [Physcomitrium patens]